MDTEKSNELNISDSEELDLVLEIYKMANEMYEIERDITYCQNALDAKENITTTVSFLSTCRSMTFDSEDLKALITSKQATLDQELRYLKKEMEIIE